MLDSSIIEQLREVFSKLEQPVVLRSDTSSHPSQPELMEMLRELSQTSEKIRLEESGKPSDVPRFELLYKGKPNGVSFRGIPGGHEFSSLILAILHSDGKGKLPDSGLIRRIQSLKGPVRLMTYISQSCENCPEVVQALNLMAILHPDFQHEMVDGAIAQSEVESLGIQGVPSVIWDEKLIHSGKISLLDLLSKLELTFGKSSVGLKEENLGIFDVAVIGGGPAGASAAIYSARKGLKTTIISEKFGGQLQETKGIENMISVAYTEGVKLSAELSHHVSRYPIQILEHRRVSNISGPLSGNETKRIQLESGEFLDAKTVIVATGAKWRELGIPGEKDHIGMGVAFCAHCDGPFYKGKKVVVVGGGNSGVEAAIDLANIATDVTLLEYSDTLKADGVLIDKLKNLPNAKIITQAKSTQVIGDGKKVVALEYLDRKTEKTERIETDGVFVQIGLLPNTQFIKGLIELTQFGEIVVDPKGRTSVPGIYAAGDVTTIPFKQIVMAMGDGAKVALTAFEDRMRAGA
jgi:alkyl hydroperoxide reductase subunit F